MKPFFKNQKLEAITPADINQYINQRLGDGVKPATINRERACLSRLFNVAIKLGKATYNPVSRVESLRENNKRSQIMTDDEFTRLIAVCDSHAKLGVLKPLVIMARLTCSLSWPKA